MVETYINGVSKSVMRFQMMTELQVMLQKEGKAYLFWETNKKTHAHTNKHQPTKQTKPLLPKDRTSDQYKFCSAYFNKAPGRLLCAQLSTDLPFSQC